MTTSPSAFATNYNYSGYDSRNGYSHGNINIQEEPRLIQQQVPDIAGSIQSGYEFGQRARLRQQQIEYYERLNSQN